MKRKILNVIIPLLCLCLSLTSCTTGVNSNGNQNLSHSSIDSVQQQTVSVPDSDSPAASNPDIDIESIPEYSGSDYVEINGNIPYFTDSDMSLQPFESYSDLDALGRCGTAFACISPVHMPTEERGNIGQVKPSGWHMVKYDCVDGKYLYNRCHLIGYQLTAENANPKNLITGTRYMNVDGMLPFENMVADYITETGNRVLYRVTPVFDGDNLVATGVLMEALSVEDQGDGICYNVFVYNIQPGVKIDYATGDSHLADINQEAPIAKEDAKPTQPENSSDTTPAEPEAKTYILNTNTKKFHVPSCHSVDTMKDENKREYMGNREDIISQGYAPCKNCFAK